MTPVPMGLVRTRLSPGLSAGVGYVVARAHDACYGEAVLGFFVVNCVSADYEDSGLARLVRAADQDVAEQVFGERDGEADDVERGEGPAAHGVHVAEGVGDGYLAEGVGVVNDGREEVHGLYERGVVVHAIDGGVVAGVDSDEQVGVGDGRKLAQDLSQVLGAELGRSTRRSWRVR